MKAVVISLDAELAWGFHDLQDPPVERIEHARGSWNRLVDLFERGDVPATWAVVGHLFLDECDGTHADHPAAGDGWFATDPGGDRVANPNWFGRDLLDRIRESDVDHDIGSHTFSHVEFGKADTSREVADAELRLANEAAEAYGVDLDSLVFPRNNVGHLDVLADNGFTCYRGNQVPRWYHRLPVTAPGKFAEYALGLSTPPVFDPTVDEHGLVNVPASLYLYGFEGAARSLVSPLTDQPILRQVKAGLESLARRDEGVFHLWLHPNNVVTEADFQRMVAVVDLINEYRRNHDVTVETMRDVAASVR
ncbi:polysaccharide deacetylase family protein [Halomarina salina]|uniref:Polysaccharide deacetylase family protein n=1 Tax=Halomarina salina TaxID=1872699 RepID=A0ABD5RQ21_9EURY|nr:polysaccharide deacetylase family protein [Halomarina salina]